VAKGHRSQIKKERNQNKDTRPSAKLSHARISAQKAGFVLDAIRGKDVANAENNNGMDPENLYVDECFANKATTMKRIRPRARGMAYRIEKRMCHITIILNER